MGKRRRGPDLWDFCGASERAAQPLDDGSESYRCQRNRGSLGETANGYRGATAWALVRWSSYRMVTEVLEWPSSSEMTVTGVPAAEFDGEGVA